MYLSIKFQKKYQITKNKLTFKNLKNYGTVKQIY